MNRDVAPQPTTDPDRGLVQRGLLLLGLMAALAVVVIMIVVQRPSTPSTGTAAAMPFVLPLGAAAAGFPAALPWGDIAVLGGQLPSPTGWEIRYNAALALARRGSRQTPWSTIREMLDEEQQRHNFPARLTGGKIMPDEEAALRTVHTTLGAVADWHKKQDASHVPSELQLVYADVDRLAESSNTQIRVQADRTRQTFFRK